MRYIPLIITVFLSSLVSAAALELDYEELARSVDGGRIRETLEFFASGESRVAGYPGCDRAAAYIEEQFRKIGLLDVRSEAFNVAVPVDKGAGLRIVGEEEEIRLYSMWPNLVRTSTLPAEGIRAKLIYGRSGAFSEFNGKDVEGAVTLMDFNTWNKWLNPAMLGTRAVIFIEPDSTVHLEAEQKFLRVPLSVPRFWIAKEDARYLLDRLGESEGEVEMTARMVWEKRPAWNLMGVIPGTHPLIGHEILVLEAYYDAMSVVPAQAPGAEMASGITGLLELARYFRKHPPARTLLFLATSGHHLGLRGICDFLSRHCRKEEHYVRFVKDPIDIRLFIGLDLSTQTDELGVWDCTSSYSYKRFFAPLGKIFMRLSEEVCKGLELNPSDMLVNGISPTGGMGWETFVPGGKINTDSEVVLNAGTPALAFVTVNDARFLVDTPFDRPGRVRYDNLTRQIAFLAGLFRLAFEEPDLFRDFDRLRMNDSLRDLQGRVMSFPRRSMVPDRPRPGAVVALKTGYQKSLKGVRGTYYDVVDERGEYYISGIGVRGVAVEAYYLSPESGDIVYAPNRGAQAKIYPTQFNMTWWMTRSLSIVFPCIATDFYDTVDPRYLTKLSSINIYGEGNSAPQEYGYSIGYGPTEPVGVLFTRPGEKVKISMSSGLIGIRFLLLNSTSTESKEKARGEGFPTLAPGAFLRTSFQAAQDMWNLDEHRINELKTYGIENNRLNVLHQRARAYLEDAEDALEERRWGAFIEYTRAALGIESRAYPDVKATQNDVVKGIIFFMALVIPCAFFAERVIFTFGDIRMQILGFAGIFLVIWVFMSFVHPAFELSHPLIILLAFIILALAVMVMLFLWGKFDTYMRRLRTEAAVVHETDVGRISASYTAFVLGISNMKRRKVRTLLTLTTLLLLTFTVISFTSIKSRLKFNEIPRDNIGLYQGALIRNRAWNPLEEAAYEYALSDFQRDAVVVPRSWYFSRSKNYIKVKGEHGSAKALGILGLTTEETEVTGLDQYLVAGRWFREDEPKVCIVSTDMANLLGIETTDVDGTQVRVFGEMFTVVGIMDSRRMNKLEDLDGEVMTPADFQLTGGQAIQEIVDQERQEKAGLEESRIVIKPFVHLSPGNVLIMPYQTLRDVGSPLQSVAVRFREGVNVREQIEDFVSRLAVTLFAGIEEPGEEHIQVSVYSSLGLTSFRGLKNLFIPILIAALIVLNTMMGSVYERFREIGIYSSVGLAPVHIAFLFIAESCVYAVLGTVTGYLFGQAVAKLLVWGGWLSGFTLNYSSLSAVSSSVLVMAVVLLSTVYPARRASQMAVPDVTRKWRLPEPEGDEWRFDFPFTVGGRDVFGLCVFLIDYFDAYSEVSIGIFYTDGAKLDVFETDAGEGYTVDMNLWLAPYDLGVSEYVMFRAVPSGEHNVYTIDLYIRRSSGEYASWRRVNQRFLNVIRKQFLIWRTISPQVKEEYQDQGRRMLAEEAVAG